MNPLWAEHLRRLRDSLLAQTDRVRAASDHTLIKGASIEVVVRRTLREYLPAKFHIGTGQVANNQQEISPQIDVLVYDHGTFPHLAANEDSSVVICCEALSAVIECKSRWDEESVAKHYQRFSVVDSKRHSNFGDPGLAAGYFVLVIDSVTPSLDRLKDEKRFVGVYSLAGDTAWSSPLHQSDFSEQSGNSLEVFLQHVMYDCMRKNLSELGSLEWTYEAVRKYFGWNFGDE